MEFRDTLAGDYAIQLFFDIFILHPPTGTDDRLKELSVTRTPPRNAT
jgi:hypothetical protein